MIRKTVGYGSERSFVMKRHAHAHAGVRGLCVGVLALFSAMSPVPVEAKSKVEKLLFRGSLTCYGGGAELLEKNGDAEQGDVGWTMSGMRSEAVDAPKLAAFRSLLSPSNDARVFLIPATRKPKLAARQTINIAVTPNGFGSSVRLRYCLRASGKRPGKLKVDVFQDGVLFETGTKAAAKTGTDYAFTTGVGVSEGTVTVRISIYSDRSPMILDNLYVQLRQPQLPA
jgi:hypothetical protein